MRAKKFFVNIGWAALYLSLILIVSTWASMVFTVGDAVARVISADGAMSDSSALMDAVLNDVYDMTDILQLMVYVTLLGNRLRKDHEVTRIAGTRTGARKVTHVRRINLATAGQKRALRGFRRIKHHRLKLHAVGGKVVSQSLHGTRAGLQTHRSAV